MARLPALISAADLADFEKMLADYRAGRLGGGTQTTGPALRSSTRLAIVTSVGGSGGIDAGVLGPIKLCNKDWQPQDYPENVMARNDSNFDIPTDTRIYVEPIQGEWRIVWAKIC